DEISSLAHLQRLAAQRVRTKAAVAIDDLRLERHLAALLEDFAHRKLDALAVARRDELEGIHRADLGIRIADRAREPRIPAQDHASGGDEAEGAGKALQHHPRRLAPALERRPRAATPAA